MDKPNAELIVVVAVMALLFLFGLAAVAIFWRTWRREQKARLTKDEARTPPANNSTTDDRT